MKVNKKLKRKRKLAYRKKAGISGDTFIYKSDGRIIASKTNLGNQ